MAKNVDVIIIGAGPGGIFCAYELMEKRPDLKVLMIEKMHLKLSHKIFSGPR